MKTIAPPDPNTRTPEYKAPPGACDSHCHVFGPGDLFPYADTRKYTPPDAAKEKLRELGFSDAALDRIPAPIGLDIGAEGADEIAVAIMAELLAVRRGHEGGVKSARAGTHHE